MFIFWPATTEKIGSPGIPAASSGPKTAQTPGIAQFAETMRREIEGTAPAPSPLS